MRLYLSGPMTGLPGSNYAAFDEAAGRLRALGFDVANPAGIDRGADHPWVWWMRSALRLLLEPDVVAVVTLEGWSLSRGARAEVHLARTLGMPYGPVESFVWIGRRANELGEPLEAFARSVLGRAGAGGLV